MEAVLSAYVCVRVPVCAYLFGAFGIISAQTEAPPDAGEQERILGLMRQYAAAYRIPDVAFDQTITTFHEPIGSNKWKKESTGYSSRFAHDGREYWRLTTKNGKPTYGAKWKPAGFLYDGDPMRMLSRAKLATSPVNEEPLATVAWERWATVRDHRLAVFTYTVSQQDSDYTLTRCAPDCTKDRGPAIGDPTNVPYTGSICVDPANGAVWRMSFIVAGIPARYNRRTVFTIADYAEVPAVTARYLLLINEVAIMRFDTSFARIERSRNNYHEFSADSSITFEQ